MGQQGCDVVLMSSSFNMPQRCASCGAPPQTTIAAKKMQTQGRMRTTRSFQIPYCMPCATRVKRATAKGWLFGGAAFGIAFVFSLLSLVAAGLPAPVLIALPILFSLGFAIVAMTALAPKDPAPPAMGKMEAVKLIKFSGASSTLYCAHPQWAAELAQMNGVQPVPKTRMSFFGGGALGIALVGAPIMAGVFWFMAHPTVYVDNAGKEALQIYM